MTSTTLDHPMNTRAATIETLPSACMQHGLIGARANCPKCGRQAYRLDDDGDRATLRAFCNASLKARVRNFAIAGYVGFVAAKSVVLMALGMGMGIDVVSMPGAVCAGLGAALAYLARRPSERRLDRMLG